MLIFFVGVGRLNTLAETYNSHWVVSRDVEEEDNRSIYITFV